MVTSLRYAPASTSRDVVEKAREEATKDLEIEISVPVKNYTLNNFEPLGGCLTFDLVALMKYCNILWLSVSAYTKHPQHQQHRCSL
eukprot:scaffold73360_cov61-Cyclotella_meneghiniana.AAC.14